MFITLAPPAWVRRSTAVALAMLVALSVWVLRNPDPLRNGILFAEDGVWLGRALLDGWYSALMHTRADYFVWGNVAGLWAAYQGNRLFNGNDLSLLPYWIAWVSYLFFAAVAVLGFFATKERLSLPVRVALFVWLLLLPVGDSLNEIVGRLLNIGYSLVFVTVLLLEARNTARSWATRTLLDVTVLLCILTNPVCLPISVLHLLLTLHRSKEALLPELRNQTLLILGTGLSGLVLGVKFLSLSGTTVQGSFLWPRFFSVVVARGLLYPFIFAYYTHFNDFCTIVFFLTWVGFVYYAMRTYASADLKRFFHFVSMSTLIFLVATFAMRPNLTHHVTPYRTTFPDRYFMGLNMLVLLISATAFGAWHSQLRSRATRLLAWCVLALFLVTNYAQLGGLFEINSPRLALKTGQTFKGQVAAALESSPNLCDACVLETPIYPEGWKMLIPASHARPTAAVEFAGTESHGGSGYPI